jgi:two-component system response regulator MprA
MAAVLVVEDEADLRILYEYALRKEGYEVVAVSGGWEAVAVVQQNRPDLVVLDIRMPELDGLKALRRILRIDGTIPVLIHSAYPEYRTDFRTWGAEDFVDKGAGIGALKSRIREVLAG